MQREKNWRRWIFQLPITEVHGVHPQLEVQLLFLIEPMKKNTLIYDSRQYIETRRNLALDYEICLTICTHCILSFRHESRNIMSWGHFSLLFFSQTPRIPPISTSILFHWQLIKQPSPLNTCSEHFFSCLAEDFS